MLVVEDDDDGDNGDDEEDTQIDETLDFLNCMDKTDSSFLSSAQDEVPPITVSNPTPTVRTLLGFFKIDFKFGAAPILVVVGEENNDDDHDDDSSPNDDAVVQVLGVNPVTYDSSNVVAATAIAKRIRNTPAA
mmetsp:Transcript_43291/g.104886  ORF Transcript_43291/g.104886 Transcript_43291/m.104886 type:complete len:133 (+) Transcript_43291:1285-1683(+)